jgi:Apea-like HEPN
LKPRRRGTLARHLLFTLAENGDPGEDRLTRWLALGEDLGPVFDLYLVSVYQPRIFAELQFLSLAQAAESLHARRFETKILPTDEHRARVKAVAEAAPVDLRDWVRERLADANRKSFRNALSELIETLPPQVKARFEDVDRFSEKVRVTRNYLTHWNEGLKMKAARGQDLVALTSLLRCVLEALLLLELGFAVDDVDLLLERNHGYQSDLNFGFSSLADHST